jgi:hypothetical protein
MRIQTVIIICLAIAALVLGLAASSPPVEAGTRSSQDIADASPLQRSVGVECARPSALRLVRFEDGSAQLKCAARVLVRVSVPG